MNDSKHILVVEDEQHLAVGIKFNLEAEGYQVTAVGDGREALQSVEQAAQPYDLVILDLMLPGMSGYAVCETLRDTGHEMPVLILSARTLAEDRSRGFDVGANQYLTKPFDLDELLSRVKNLLSRGPQTRSANRDGLKRLRFGNADVDFERHEVVVDEKAVRMTQLELKLLKYFAEHSERVIPRGELLENVWGMPGHVHTRAPDQFIRRLRRIFEPEPSQPIHFLTVRDAGYRFLPNPDEGSDD